MNNLTKTILVAFISLFFSCSKHNPEPLFKDIYIYKNLLPNNVSIDFYRRNSEKETVEIKDSISIPSNHNRFNYTFDPSANDSIIIKFSDRKKIVFKYEPNSSNWNLNAINYRIYKKTNIIKGNLTTQFYTYIIDNKIYELAK